MTLRQEIDWALHDLNLGFINKKEALNRICEAIGKAAVGMPKTKDVMIANYSCSDEDTAKELGMETMWDSCQTYWQKELGK